MKVAHHNKEHFDSGEDLLQEAQNFEKNKELDKAASLYLRYLRKLPGNEYAYSRLMIIYRKLGQREKELEIIDRGIQAFEEIFRKAVKIAPTKKTIEISKKLMKSMGMTDKKGKELLEREPLKKWHRRKALLQKRRATKNRNGR